MRSLKSLLDVFYRWRKGMGWLLLLLLLLPMVGNSPASKGVPVTEGAWPQAFAFPRPTLPGEPGVLEANRTIPAGLRVRLHRVKDPAALVGKLLKNPGEAVIEGSHRGADPFDIMREAFLWGGRRAFVTVHGVASGALRDTAREMTRLKQPTLRGNSPRQGDAVPLEEGQEGLSLMAEMAPSTPKGQPNAIALPPQQAGLYLVELIAAEDSAYVPWLVTDLALFAEQDGEKLRLRALDARDGSLKPNVTVQVYENGVAKAVALDGSGMGSVPAGPGVRRVAWATAGSSHALLAIEGIGAGAPQQRIYAYTERPLYRPGQEVNVKAIVRKVEQGENVIPPAVGEMAYRVLDPEDTEVCKGKAKVLNAHTATLGATFTLPGAGRLGLYRVVFDGLAGPALAEFKVEQFVKPTFAVTVTTPNSKVGVGDELSYGIQARYFYGAAVRAEKVEWFLYQVRPSLNFWDDNDAGPAPELKESGTLSLDEQGAAKLSGLSAKEEGVWRLVVKVTDPAGQRNSGQAQVRCSKGDLVLFLSPDRELVSPTEPFQATVKVLDLDGNEVKGVSVAIKACAIRFTQRGKETGQSDAWSWSYQHRPGKTLSEGKGPVATLRIPESGLHLLYAEATDRAGRKVEAIRPITVAAEGSPLPASKDLKAMPDKREYRVGEKARLLVRLPRPNLTLHWAVESENLAQKYHRKVPGTSTIVEVPMTPAMQPNAWAVFEILAEGCRQMVEVPLRAPKVEKRLDVKVLPDLERYRPGDTMKVAVEVRDHRGRPTAADVSLGVVDEAIYALSAELHPDPFRFFHPVRRHMVVRAGSTDWSFSDIMHRGRPAWSLKQTRKGELKEQGDKIRKNFKDTAAWMPYLAAGADGRVTGELVLPDNLTAWRATALAVTSDTKVGVGRAKRPASKPLQVSLTLPRTLAKGEEARAIALVRNLSGGPLQGKVSLKVTNGAVHGAPDASFHLVDQGEYRLSLPLFPAEAGPLTVVARVEGGVYKDAEQQSVMVVEPLVPASINGVVRLNGQPQTVDIPLPPKAQGEASLVFMPLAGLENLVLPSLPYLVQYPYGCVEQTLSSFVPNVMLADLIERKLAPAVDWKALTNLERNIRDGVFRVYGYQQENGSWGWYAPGEFAGQANPHTTGYAIQCFAIMKRLGYPVDDKVFLRGKGAAKVLFGELAQAADQGKGLRRSTDVTGDAAFTLLSLAIAGEPIQGLLDVSSDKVLKGAWKGTPALVMLAQAAAETRHPKTAALMAALEKAATVKDGIAHWESSADHWFDYHGGDTLPTLHAIKALCLQKPQSPLIEQAALHLCQNFKGRGWDSTWATSQVVSVMPYLAKVRPLRWEPPVLSASIEGGPTLSLRLPVAEAFSYDSEGARKGKGSVSLANVYPMASPKACRVTLQGTGAVIWTYAHQVPGGTAAAQTFATPLKLDLNRNLWRLKTPQETGQPAKGWLRQPWTGSLKLGEEAWMELELGTSKHCSYAILEVPLPAGLEPTVKLEGFVLEGRPFGEGDATDEWEKPRIEVRSDKVVFLFQSLCDWRKVRVRLHLRASMAGHYCLRPAKLSLMSCESQWTTCPAQPVRVVEVKR